MDTVSLVDKLTQVEERYQDLERLLADPAVATDDNLVREYAQERAEIAELRYIVIQRADVWHDS
jgi:protein subunit release factor A